MSELSNYIGFESKPIEYVVEKGAVRKFAEAIGDLNPLYVDEEAAKKSVYGRLIAPPTFPRSFNYRIIEGFPMPDKGLIHGGQSFSYIRPLYVGDRVLCRTKIKNIFEKTGSTETLTFIIIECDGETLDGQSIFTVTESLIIPELVRKGMKVG